MDTIEHRYNQKLYCLEFGFSILEVVYRIYAFCQCYREEPSQKLCTKFKAECLQAYFKIRSNNTKTNV